MGRPTSKTFAASEVTGQMVSTQLADAAVTAAKLAANAVDATKFASSIEPVTIVGSLPATKSTSYVSFNNESYRWNGTAYVKTFAAVEVTGQLISSQITDSAVTAAKLADAAVTANKLAANVVDATKLASSIEPVTVVGSLPGTRVTAYVTFGGESYRWNGTSYVKTFCGGRSNWSNDQRPDSRSFHR